MRRNLRRDFLAGLFVLARLAAVPVLCFTVGGRNNGGGKGLTLYATFDQVAGLKPRAPVEIAGVKVGQVTRISLNEDYRARVDLEVDAALELPFDTSASVVTAGILGDKYVALELGAESEYLQPGEQIAYTESALVLERLIGKFLYNVDSEDE